MKTILILTGPQGSGNHLWSKVLGLHASVLGWQDLQQEYWIGHDREPFNECWRDVNLLADFDWSVSDYYVTSISVPYMDNGKATIPPIRAFGEACERLGLRVIYGIIGRDRNILGMQEQRLRSGETYPMALEIYQRLPLERIYYLSHELLILYRQRYLAKIGQDLDFPVAVQDPRVEEFLEDNANAKYLRPIEHHWVDDLARLTSSQWR